MRRKRLPRKRLLPEIITYLEAKALGLNRYYTGKPCKRGHITKRMIPSGSCVDCVSLMGRDWRSRHPNRVYLNRKRWSTNNPDKMYDYREVWKEANRDAYVSMQDAYRFSTAGKTKRSITRGIRYETDIEYRLKERLRGRLRTALTRLGLNKGNGSATRDLGCTLDFLRDHIESQFDAYMTWDNYGSYWQLDHIVPLYMFKLTDREQFLNACNWSNLQPLTVEQHKIKTAHEKARLRLRRSLYAS